MNARNGAAVNALFFKMIGEQPPEPENYAMRAGSAMEPVIIDEFERRSGEKLTRRQEIVDHPTIKDFCCTLDGWVASRRLVVEAKFASPFMGREELFQLYYPQVAFQMTCTDAVEGVLVVGQGTSEPWEVECIRDADYERELIQRCEAFLLCVKTLAPPCALPIVVPPEKWRTINVAADEPNWGPELLAALVEYDETAKAAEAHEAWGKLARELIPDDVGKVIAGDFTLSRNKKGVISIRRAA